MFNNSLTKLILLLFLAALPAWAGNFVLLRQTPEGVRAEKLVSFDTSKLPELVQAGHIVLPEGTDPGDLTTKKIIDGQLVDLTPEEIAARTAAQDARDAAEVDARITFANLSPEEQVMWKVLLLYINQTRAGTTAQLTDDDVTQTMRAIAKAARKAAANKK